MQIRSKVSGGVGYRPSCELMQEVDFFAHSFFIKAYLKTSVFKDCPIDTIFKIRYILMIEHFKMFVF